jgi:hypothetical protein
MSLIFGTRICRFLRRISLFSAIFLVVFAISPTTDRARQIAPRGAATSDHLFLPALATAENSEASVDTIPAGTVLAVRLPSISSERVKKGDTIKAKIAQDVPLPGGAKIRAGTTVLGSVIATTAAGSGSGATLTLKFDALVQHGKSTPIRTNLRALASPLEVEFAQIPTSGPGESDVYDWLTTVQVGGDVVYGKQGPVVGDSGTVGKSLFDGVLVRVLANAHGSCRGAIAGNDSPQALWVFSSDACGVYGFPRLEIRHAGRTTPLGEIVLESTKGPVQIRSGSGALLRVGPGSE